VTEPSTPGLPSRAQVVVVGGGVIGCSVAYHLTKQGWRDVVLLNRAGSPAAPPGMRRVWWGNCAPTRT